MSVHARAVAARRTLYTSVQLAANGLHNRHTTADPGTRFVCTFAGVTGARRDQVHARQEESRRTPVLVAVVSN